MTYDFKILEEAGWAALIGALLMLLQILVLFDPTKITDWKVWALAGAGALIRAAAGAAIAFFGVNKLSGDSGTPPA